MNNRCRIRDTLQLKLKMRQKNNWVQFYSNSFFWGYSGGGEPLKKGTFGLVCRVGKMAALVVINTRRWVRWKQSNGCRCLGGSQYGATEHSISIRKCPPNVFKEKKINKKKQKRLKFQFCKRFVLGNQCCLYEN